MSRQDHPRLRARAGLSVCDRPLLFVLRARLIVGFFGVLLVSGCHRDSPATADAAPPPDAAPPDTAFDGSRGQGGTSPPDATDATTGGAISGGVDALASAGCAAVGQSRYRAGSQEGTIMVGDRPRTFVLRLPPAASGTASVAPRPMPLVLLFHGGLGTGAQLEESARMSSIADREGFAIAYPDGVARTWNGGGCCGSAVAQNIDDVGFVSALIDHLNADLCLDRKRIYAGGMSNGAIFSHRLACDLSERFAAVASVAGANMASPCAPTRPVALIHIHGTADHNVPWYGGAGCGLSDNVSFPSVSDSVQGAVKRNACANANPALVVQQGDGRCERQGTCTGDGEVVLCTVAQRGHSWPGGAPDQLTLPACQRAGDGGQSTTFLASEQIWAFFARHSLP